MSQDVCAAMHLAWGARGGGAARGGVLNCMLMRMHACMALSIVLLYMYRVIPAYSAAGAHQRPAAGTRDVYRYLRHRHGERLCAGRRGIYWTRAS